MTTLTATAGQPLVMREGLLFDGIADGEVAWIQPYRLFRVATGDGVFTVTGIAMGQTNAAGFPISAGGTITGLTFTGAQAAFTISGLSVHASQFTAYVSDPTTMVAWMFAGDDTITGGAAADWVDGGAGDDLLRGGAGEDMLVGGAGADRMYGGAGGDTYRVDNAGDRVFELDGEGNDFVYSSVSYSLVGQYIENLTLTGSANLHATGNAMSNTLTGNTGNNVLDGGYSEDLLIGGAGNDTYHVNSSRDLVIEFANEGLDTVISSASFSLGGRHIENLTLTGWDDLNATGNGLANILRGNHGNNVLNGGGGDDVMVGGAGNDVYYVDSPGDRVAEAPDEGVDTVISAVSFTLVSRGIENLTFTGLADVKGVGNTLDNVLRGAGGWTILEGGAGGDTLIFAGQIGEHDRANEGYGGAGDDLIYGAGTQLNAWGDAGNDKLKGSTTGDYLYGGDGADLLYGGGGADYMHGGEGPDRLFDGAGVDRLVGGEGADRFVFQEGSLAPARTAAQLDRVLDFRAADGDLVDLSLIDADVTCAGDQAFHLSATTGFTKQAGEYVVYVGAGYVLASFDTNGDGVTDFALRVDGAVNGVDGWLL